MAKRESFVYSNNFTQLLLAQAKLMKLGEKNFKGIVVLLLANWKFFHELADYTKISYLQNMRHGINALRRNNDPVISAHS